MEYELLNVGRNAKTVKSDKTGKFTTGILYLAPGIKSGYEVCPFRSNGCDKGCLYTAGYGDATHVREARIRKTKVFFEDRDRFMAMLYQDIRKLYLKTKKQGGRTTIRLNGTSDIMWEAVPLEHDDWKYNSLFHAFPNVQFYDYTKIPDRDQLPDNYHITFSLAEDNMDEARQAMARGLNISAVFPDARFPATFLGRPVINGDKHDLRFLDPTGVVVGLKAKGAARKDETGFVQDPDYDFKQIYGRAVS